MSLDSIDVPSNAGSCPNVLARSATLCGAWLFAIKAKRPESTAYVKAVKAAGYCSWSQFETQPHDVDAALSRLTWAQQCFIMVSRGVSRAWTSARALASALKRAASLPLAATSASAEIFFACWTTLERSHAVKATDNSIPGGSPLGIEPMMLVLEC